MAGVNRFAVEHLQVVFPDDVENWGLPIDVAAPLIDGVRLSEMLDDRFPGIELAFVAPPSRHWLGVPDYVEYDRPVILDGGCGFAGCCGVVASITFDGETVRWHDFYTHGSPPVPDDLGFSFAWSEYTAAIEAVASQPPRPWRIDDSPRTDLPYCVAGVLARRRGLAGAVRAIGTHS